MSTKKKIIFGLIFAMIACFMGSFLLPHPRGELSPLTLVGGGIETFLIGWLFFSIVIRFVKSVHRRFGTAGVVAMTAGAFVVASKAANGGGGGGGGFAPPSMHGRED